MCVMPSKQNYLHLPSALLGGYVIVYECNSLVVILLLQTVTGAGACGQGVTLPVDQGGRSVLGSVSSQLTTAWTALVLDRKRGSVTTLCVVRVSQTHHLFYFYAIFLID